MGKKNSAPHDHIVSSLGKPRDTTQWSSDIFFYLIPTPMIDTYTRNLRLDDLFKHLQASQVCGLFVCVFNIPPTAWFYRDKTTAEISPKSVSK